MNAGTFYLNANNSVGNRNRNISSHLVNARISRGSNSPGCFNKLWYPFDPATWQNTESYLIGKEKEKLCW